MYTLRKSFITLSIVPKEKKEEKKKLYLIFQLLCEALSFVQRKPRHKCCSEDMFVAQLFYHLWYVEERMVLQQLPGHKQSS